MDDDMIDIEVSKELARRLEKLAKGDGITVDLLLRRIVADATV